jgi:hypothetical protein
VRIWDVAAGYLSRQRLLGEHRELHGLASILINGKKGYANHPETVRWRGSLSGLVERHETLAAEMRLRGYTDRSPLARPEKGVRWPERFVTPVAGQFELLRLKYRGTSSGRIPLPANAQELWAHHKYSVLARDPEVYGEIGRRVARIRRGTAMSPLADDLVLLLRQPLSRPRVVNALEHMWGHVSDEASDAERALARGSPRALLRAIWALSARIEDPYLCHSTALSDLETAPGLDPVA